MSARAPLLEEPYDDLLRFNPMERVEFSFGMLLDVAEFEIEQAERLLRRRIHQAMLHGYGTAVGLDVKTKTDEAERQIAVIVQPGWAIDALGRDIWVDQKMCLDVSKLHEHPIWEELPDLDGVKTLCIVARWIGLLDSRIPSAHAASCAPSESGLVYSRQRDGARIDVAAVMPLPSPLPVRFNEEFGATRDRWRDAIVDNADAVAQLRRIWQGPSDAPVLLACVQVQRVEDITEIIDVDVSARPILPAVQSLAEWHAHETLRGEADVFFAVMNIDVEQDGDEAVFHFDLTQNVHPGSVFSSVTAAALSVGDSGWQDLDLSGRISLEDGDTTIVIRVDTSSFIPDTILEISIAGAGRKPLITPDATPLQGSLVNPHVQAKSGADVTHRVSWPF